MQQAVRPWGRTVVLAKQPVKIACILKSALSCHLFDRQIIGAQKVRGMLDADLVDVLRRSHAEALMHCATDMFVASAARLDEGGCATAEDFG